VHSGEGLLELNEGAAVCLGRVEPAISLGDLEEHLLRLVEQQVLLPPDAGLALQDRRPLDLGELLGDLPVDSAAEAQLVTLALVHEMEPPGVAALVDPITMCHS